MGRETVLFFLGALGGAITATGVCVLTLKWPVICSVDGTLFWGAVGAIGTIVTGTGAVYASRKAADIALKQASYQVGKGNNRTRIIAELVRDELIGAQGRVPIIRLMSNFRGTDDDFLRIMRNTTFIEPKTSTQYVLDLDTLPDGHSLARAIASMRKLTQTLAGIHQLESMKDMEGFGTTLSGARIILAEELDEAEQAIDDALKVLPESKEGK